MTWLDAGRLLVDDRIEERRVRKVVGIGATGFRAGTAWAGLGAGMTIGWIGRSHWMVAIAGVGVSAWKTGLPKYWARILSLDFSERKRPQQPILADGS